MNGRNDGSRGYNRKEQNRHRSSLVLITVAILSGLSLKVLAEPPCKAESPFELVVNKAAETNTAYKISPEQQKTLAYPQHDVHGTITDKRVADTDDSAGLDKYDVNMIPLIKKYPRNYHSQLFQNLDLHDENGKRMLFTKIISNYALGYVLEIKEIPEKVRFEMLDRVIDHLASGGKLIIFPMTLSKEDPFGAAFYSRLAELRKNKIISDYSVHEKDGVLSWVLVK